MSSVAVDVFCHACSRLSLAAEYPPSFNDDHERVCPQCNSDFIELRERENAQASTQSQTSTLPAAHDIAGGSGIMPLGTSSQTIVTPDGLHLDLLVTTAVVPNDFYEQVRRQTGGQAGSAVVLTMGENGMLMSGAPPNLPGLGNFGNLGDFAMGANFDQLLDRLMQQYQPPNQSTSQQILDALPRRFVRDTTTNEAAAAAVVAAAAGIGDDEEGLYASCAAGEPCTVCHDDFKDGELVIELPCGHCFHEDCILPWLATHNTCPVCRHKLERESSQRRPRDALPNPAPTGRIADDELPNLLIGSDEDSDDEEGFDDMPPLVDEQELVRDRWPTAQSTPVEGGALAPMAARLTQLQDLLSQQLDAQQQMREQMTDIRARSSEVLRRYLHLQADTDNALPPPSSSEQHPASSASLLERPPFPTRLSLSERARARAERVARRASPTSTATHPTDYTLSTSTSATSTHALNLSATPSTTRTPPLTTTTRTPSTITLPQPPTTPANVYIPQALLRRADSLTARVRWETGLTDPAALSEEVTRRMVEAVNGGSRRITQLMVSLTREQLGLPPSVLEAGRDARERQDFRAELGHLAGRGTPTRPASSDLSPGNPTPATITPTPAPAAPSTSTSTSAATASPVPLTSTTLPSASPTLAATRTLSPHTSPKPFISSDPQAADLSLTPPSSTHPATPTPPAATGSSIVRPRPTLPHSTALIPAPPTHLPFPLHFISRVISWAFHSLRSLLRM